MRVITTRQIVRQTKTYFDLAETERIAVKRGNKYVNMLIADKPDKVYLDEDWLKLYFSIPSEYRCNPFDVSPSGDIFWADKRNVEKLDLSIKQVQEGKVKRLSKKDQKEFFSL